jgi:adenine-specific DNA-methyltransferase
VRQRRKAVGAEIVAEYLRIAKQRVTLAAAGQLRTRPMDRPVYDPKKANGNGSSNGTTYKNGNRDQLVLLDSRLGSRTKLGKDLVHA